MKLTVAASIIAGFVAICGVEYLAYRSNLLDAQAKLYHASGQELPQAPNPVLPARKWRSAMQSIRRFSYLPFYPGGYYKLPVWTFSLDGKDVGSVYGGWDTDLDSEPAPCFISVCKDVHVAVDWSTLAEAKADVERTCTREPQ